MKTAWNSVLSIRALLPFVAAALLVLSEPTAEALSPSPSETLSSMPSEAHSPDKAEPSSAVSRASEACSLDCTQGGNLCVRRDFNLVRVEYRREFIHEYAQRAGNGYEWEFLSTNSYPAHGAELILTWEMKREIRGTACAEAIWKGAELGNENPWYLQTRFIHPHQPFDGNAVVDRNSSIIQKRIPLGNLQPSNYGMGYRLQFGVVYQDYPTCLTYQDPNNQMIIFAAPAGGDQPSTGNEDPPRISREALRWSAPITAENLGQQPDPEILNKSLSQIINSVVEARPDDVVCSVCHHSSGGFSYRPSVTQAQATPGQITPSTSIARGRSGEYSWNETGTSGIIYAFKNANPDKPPYLKTALEKWAADGYLP